MSDYELTVVLTIAAIVIDFCLIVGAAYIRAGRPQNRIGMQNYKRRK